MKPVYFIMLKCVQNLFPGQVMHYTKKEPIKMVTSPL